MSGTGAAGTTADDGTFSFDLTFASDPQELNFECADNWTPNAAVIAYAFGQVSFKSTNDSGETSTARFNLLQFYADRDIQVAALTGEHPQNPRLYISEAY